MKCPHCNFHKTDVKDSRPVKVDPRFVRRRRWCKNCRKRITTTEIPLAPHELAQKFELLERATGQLTDDQWSALLALAKATAISVTEGAN